MRIGSTDAFRGVEKATVSEAIPRTQAVKINKGDMLQPKTNIKESIDNEILEEAIERFNRAVSGYNRECQISIHEGTGSIMVKIIDTETKEIVREIPPEKILNIVARMCELAGIFVDERR